MHDSLIWGFLMSKIGNPYGVAGLLGEFYTESKLNPASLCGAPGEEYTSKTDSCVYTDFIQDGLGYGLAQWVSLSRKEALLKYARNANCSVGDLSMQLNFVWQELRSSKECLRLLNKANSILNASDAIITYYQDPEKSHENIAENTVEFAQKFYNKFVKTKGKTVEILRENTKIYTGNSTKYSVSGQVSKGDVFPWVATAGNGWHAIQYKEQVAWVNNEFSKA